MCVYADCTLNETLKYCACMPGYTWSEDMCNNNDCCNNNCIQKLHDTDVCLLKTRGRVLFDTGTGFQERKKELIKCCDSYFLQ